MTVHRVVIGSSVYDVQLESPGSALVNGIRKSIDIRPVGGKRYSLLVDGTSVNVIITGAAGEYKAVLDANPLEVTVESEKARLLKRYTRSASVLTGRTEIRAPMPALIVKIEVSPGERIESGRGLVVLEAMKMENELRAHQAGRVKDILVTPGKAVEKGELLIVIE